jgi:hypothetical protein
MPVPPLPLWERAGERGSYARCLVSMTDLSVFQYNKQRRAPLITHVVLFKLKDRSPESIYKAEQVLRGLEGKVPVIRSIEVGVDALRSQRSYDIALTVKFDTLKTSRPIRPPEHVLVADYIASVRDSVAVVDYEGR